MELKWLLITGFWNCILTIQNIMYRAKKNYYHIGITFIMISLICVYIWSWRMCEKEIEENSIRPYQANIHISSDIGCQFPYIDPFSTVAMKFNKDMPKVTCEGEDWVECNISECKLTQNILSKMKSLTCHYKDIVYVDDHSHKVAPSVAVTNDNVYVLNRSDFVKVSCFGYNKDGLGLLSKRWHGYKAGIRPIRPPKVPEGREKSVNILILGFDSAAHSGFVRKMPKTYKRLSEIGAVILKGYNIVGDGTPDALFPILSGRTELQHPNARQRYSKEIHLDPDLFIFHTAKLDGYETAYYEDMPWIGSFQYRYNGFSKCPSDHYLRSFFMEESKDGSKWWKGIKNRYCIGAKPQYMVMLNLTKQFMNTKTKRFCFTFIADISHDDFNLISTADDDVVEFLNYMKFSGILNNTLLIVMGDHGPRFSPMRATYQGKLEERLPLMSIRLPEVLKHERPQAQMSLEFNANVLTTPFDIHTTLLDSMGLYTLASNFSVPNVKIRRGLSLLTPIPKSRSCDEAGILPHWCVCLNTKWYNVPNKDDMYKKVGDAIAGFINNITFEMRSLCALRQLTSIEWVTRQSMEKKSKEKQNVYYQAMIIMSPGRAVFESSLQYDGVLDKFIISDSDVSRISAYGNEPACVSASHPHLNKYCYCISAFSRVIKGI